MKRQPARLVALLSVCFVTGCATTRVPLTAELRQEHGLGAVELRRLQLYVSHEVRLRRELERHGRQIDAGALRLQKGRTVDEVVIRERTPCIATRVEDRAITVAFEDGSTLEFALGEDPEQNPQPEPSQRLAATFAEAPSSPLLASPSRRLLREAHGAYVLAASHGITHYRGLAWHADGESLRSALLVNAEEQGDLDENRIVLDGKRL
jgi:hypothetical protein